MCIIKMEGGENMEKKEEQLEEVVSVSCGTCDVN